LPAGTVVSMLDTEGTVLAQQPGGAESIGKPYHLPGMLEVIPAGNKDGTGEARGSDGVARLFAYTRLPGEAGSGAAGFVAVSIARDSVLAVADRAFSLNLGLLAALSLLGLLGTWYATDRLVLRRMRALIATARRIAAGDFAARTELKGGSSELSELARVFDEMAASLQQFFEQTQRVMEVAPEAFVVSDEQGRIVMVNAQTEKLFGYCREELLGQHIDMLLPERARTLHARHRQTYVAAPVVRDMSERRDLAARRKDGTEFPVDISLGPLQTEKGRLVISAVRDISERKEFESRILHQATHDALTNLPNRVLFREHVSRAMLHATRSEELIAVLFLDLDGFKNINDTLGHEAGDELLKAVTSRLTGILREDDLIGRQGGDEFTILLQGIRIVQDIVLVLEKLLTAIAEPFVLGSNEMHVTASVGVTVFPFDDNEVESLLRNADTAMYQAKEAGKNCFRFYTAEMNTAMRERMEIENGLRHALAQGQFSLHYQPQVSIEDGAVVGVEALLRWHHPELGMISPAKFIPVAEESGMIVPIGEWVLRTACRQVKAWEAAGLPRLKVAVNLSARQFRQSDLLEMIGQVLQETGLDPRSGMLELELTESMVMRNVEDSVVTLNSMHQMGLPLSIDDFGTGYSSLSYLKRFPINTLKIDQSFVRDISTDPEDAAIAAAIVGLAHSLKLNVIAEGVETREQLEFLRAISCNQAQGYYFSRPLAPDALEKFLRAAMADSAYSPV
jgi:diguanylate cyclase (GGDEF)-like protein/PAS domain S-box-containing protein